MVGVRNLGLERTVGDDLGEAVAHGQGHLVDAGHVLYGALGSHSAECGHVRYVVLAVLLFYIAEHVAPAVIVEVDVYVGHIDTVRVEETLEQQVVFQGVDVGDVQAVGHNASGRAASSGADPGAFCPCRRDEVLHDEEVVREAHIRNGLQFELYLAGLLLGELLAVALLGSLVGQVAEVGHRPGEVLAARSSGCVVQAGIDNVLVSGKIGVDVFGEVVGKDELRQDGR